MATDDLLNLALQVRTAIGRDTSPEVVARMERKILMMTSSEVNSERATQKRLLHQIGKAPN